MSTLNYKIPQGTGWWRLHQVTGLSQQQLKQSNPGTHWLATHNQHSVPRAGAIIRLPAGPVKMSLQQVAQQHASHVALGAQGVQTAKNVLTQSIRTISRTPLGRALGDAHSVAQLLLFGTGATAASDPTDGELIRAAGNAGAVAALLVFAAVQQMEGAIDAATGWGTPVSALLGDLGRVIGREIGLSVQEIRHRSGNVWAQGSKNWRSRGGAASRPGEPPNAGQSRRVQTTRRIRTCWEETLPNGRVRTRCQTTLVTE